MRITKTKADIGLLSVTLFWGTTFIVSKLVLTKITLAEYLAVRLTIAAFVMFLIALKYRREFKIKTLKHGIILGFLLFFSYYFQMWGIQFTSASNAGFITGISVVMVPIFAFLFFRDKPKLSSVFGVILAATGLYLLTGGNINHLNKGDILVFICAVSVTFHVIFTGKYARRNNIYVLTSIQLITTAVLALLIGHIKTVSLDVFINFNILLILTYLAVFGTVYTFLMQTSMQRYTTATRTAIVFSMEPVFAALFAYLLAGEKLDMLGWIGGIFILAGMIVTEINWNSIFSAKSAK